MKKRKLKLYKNLWIFLNSLGIAILLVAGILQILTCQQKTENVIPNLRIEATEKIPERESVQKLNLIMVGDSLIHSALYADAKTENGYNFHPMLENVREYIKSYDLAFYNQESILGGTEIGLSTYPRFNSPYEVGDAFQEAGFNIVSLANNHTLDRGEQAIINSKNYWNQQNVLTAGSYQNQEEKDEIKIFEKNGITYTLLSYTDTTNGIPVPKEKEYLVNRYLEEQVKEDIEKVRDKVDLLLVSIHFGEEYTHTPNERQKQIASTLASLGVDIVIGHHPHVVQPIEFIDHTMVIYSLGNFLSAQQGVEKLTGLMASVEVKKITMGQESKIVLEYPTAELTYTASDTVHGYRQNYRLYRYQDLTDDLLPNYKMFQEKYINIVTRGNNRIEAR